MQRSSGVQLLLTKYAVGAAAVALPPPLGDTTECAAVSHKLCVECGKMLDSVTGYVNSKSQRTGKLYLNSACRPCHNRACGGKTEAEASTPPGWLTMRMLRKRFLAISGAHAW